MKRCNIVLFASLLISVASAWCQTGNGMPQAAFNWRCAAGNYQLNYNPATTGTLSFDSIPYAKDYTLIVVYKPIADAEATVWELTFADSIVYALTTNRIIANTTDIRYNDLTDRSPVIHTLRQSAPDIDTGLIHLSVGYSDLMVAEVLYFDHRLGNASLRRVQSALAIRYGITLGPVDYLSADGGHIWRHDSDSALYHHRITGVGRDTIAGLSQTVSHSEMEGGIVTIATAGLAPQTFFLFGDNDAELAFHNREWLTGGDCEVLARNWRIQSTGATDNFYTLTFDIRDLPLPTDSLVLLVDNNIYLPYSVSPNEVVFDDVVFPTDSSIFTLARGAHMWHLTQTNGNKGGMTYSNGHKLAEAAADNTLSANIDTQVSLYPNPTNDRFTLDVAGANQVQVTIYNQQGKVMATYSDSERETYRFEGSLPSGNAYYVTVATESGSQTMKLVVK
ncbi:MAG: T9SS type A sorting domain-containing protein [Bacteroidales bacterium]|nr:T9SS type A sorting domain-containing protein [Bacteroidales bacterium]